MSTVQNLPVVDDDGSQRLDRWLRKRFPHIGQSRIERMCRKGEIRVDGKRAQASFRLEPGQIVRVPPVAETPNAQPAKLSEPREISSADAAMIRTSVLYRDEDVIAINKPPGLPVQGGSGHPERHVDALAEALRFGGEHKPRLVHRLDRDTSGVLLLAATPRAASALARSFQARETRKLYWSVVSGVPRPGTGSVNLGLVKRMTGGQKEMMDTVDPQLVAATKDARHALSDYAVIEAAGTRAAWLALSPITGRTHQLRAHMAAIGCPIVGDPRYGKRTQDNLGDGWGASLGGAVSRKLHLHARSIRITHPRTKATLHITAPLPDHMQRTWELFGWDPREAPDDPFGAEL